MMATVWNLERQAAGRRGARSQCSSVANAYGHGYDASPTDDMDERSAMMSATDEEQTDNPLNAFPPDDPSTNRWKRTRDLTAFWLFGLCNNYAYVIMLSAAYDILEGETATPTQIPPITDPSVDWQNISNSSNSPNPYDCHKSSTAVVLLADIIPSLIIKYTSPWFAELVPFDVRIAACVLTTVASFIIVSLSHTIPLSLVGVACASAASGLGEFSFLSLATYYDKDVVSTWSSGTGAAGLFGALSYAGLTGLGLSPRNTILVMLVVPVVMAASYWLLLVQHPGVHNCDWCRRSNKNYTALTESGTETEVGARLPFGEKKIVIKSVLYLIVPLAVVYIAEYFINQGLFELVFFHNIWMSHEEQYRWYQVLYQLGVFISRSSVNLLLIRKTWILAVLQVGNVVIFVTQLFYFYIPSIWIVLALILYEGLLGGAAYVNTFYIIRKDMESTRKEFAMGVTCVADSTGIAIAAAMAVPAHAAFCNRIIR